MIKKLIEVALPLDAINAASAREKSIRHGHPSTLHLWWSRKPTATARAVIFASLVDAPSSHPELFPTEEEQERERQRLFHIIEKLVIWENSNNEEVLVQARAEIRKWTHDDPPALLDPFAGGGAIPLEAQRLGLKAYAGDLNPVAVMINKAMIEIPSRFSGKPAVNPDVSMRRSTAWKKAAGLAADVHYYGQLLKEKAYEKIGQLYPTVTLPNGKEGTVIAWKWARTVKCPNPACGCEMPLVNSFWLSKKKGKETYVLPIVEGNTVRFEIRHGDDAPEGTVNRSGAKCVCCGTSVSLEYIRNAGKTKKMSTKMLAIVGDTSAGRCYLLPDNNQVIHAELSKPKDFPDAEIAFNPRDFRTGMYGLSNFSDLFTNRQLTALTTFCELLDDIQQQVYQDALKAGFSDDSIKLADGGTGAVAYSEAVRVYLAFLIDKLTDYHSSICSWHSSREIVRNTFGRQAIPMVWDYAEANPFSDSTGCYDSMLGWIEKCLREFPTGIEGQVCQSDAEIDNGLRKIMVSTDPPYYDNIGYADLSDYFYIWLRKNLKNVYPDIFSTLLVPKQAELIANPYRFDGSKQRAKEFFEDGMYCTCQQIYQYTQDDIPVTIYYAFKQSDSDASGTTSSGWETMLSAIIRAGFSITGTWPMRTEMTNRSVANGTNALASSIVLVCRKRQSDHTVCTRKQFQRALKSELQEALHKMQSANIAPVDLAQSAIGPGISVYSRYDQVLEADGSPMNVRTALMLINQAVDEFFEGENAVLDSESRFCITLYMQSGFNEIAFGTADELARAKNTSVAALQRKGMVISAKGQVRLADRNELPAFGTVENPADWLVMQQLVQLMASQGIQGCANAIKKQVGDLGYVKNLAYRLYTIAERKGWSGEGIAYNDLVISWPDILEQAEQLSHSDYTDDALF